VWDRKAGRPQGGRLGEGLKGVCVWVGNGEEEGRGRGGEQREESDDALSPWHGAKNVCKRANGDQYELFM